MANAPTNQLLADRAGHFRDLVMSMAMGPGGMIIDFVDFKTRRPVQEGEEYPPDSDAYSMAFWNHRVPHPTVAESWYGENTLWATGWFLHAQMIRYRVTGEPEALELARKCFRDLLHYFRLSWEIEPGLLGKPHGGRAGGTVSYDQAANPVIFFVQFAKEFGTESEKALAHKYMHAHGDWYTRRNWVVNHHGNLAHVIDNPHTSLLKYLACVYAAYDMTGETRYRDEAFKWVRKLGELGRLPFATNPYETNHNLYYYAILAEYFRNTEIGQEFDWTGFMRTYWRAARHTFDHDGLFLFGSYDHQADRFARYEDKWLTMDQARGIPSAQAREKKTWLSATSMGNRPLNSALMAALALLARQHGLDEHGDAVALATKTLERMDESTLLWWWRDETMPPELYPNAEFFATEVPAAWLIAYWMGRQQGVW